MIPLILLSALASGPDAQPLRISTSGFCSPVFVNVSGPVTVTCKGVDPRALDALNRKLDQLKVSYQEKVAQANDWAARYHTLEESLKEESDGSEMARQAEENLKQGKLDEAVALLKQLTATKDRENVDKAALHNYETGIALEMQFKTPEALSYLEEAQQIRPREPRYATEYARALLRENRLADARAVYDRILPWLEDQSHKDYKVARVYMFALDDASRLYSLQGDNERAISAENNAFFKCLALEALQNTIAGAQCDDRTLFMIGAGLGSLLMDQGQYEQAEGFLGQALQNIQDASNDGTANLPEQAQLLTEIGRALEKQQKYSEAEKALSMASGIETMLRSDDPNTRLIKAATSALSGSVEFHLEDFDRGYYNFDKAAGIYRDLARQDPEAYLPVLESVLYTWAGGNFEAKRFEQAKPVYEEVLPILEKLAAADPQNYLSDLSSTYSSLAMIHNLAKDFDESLRLGKLSIETSRKLNPTPDHLEILGKKLSSLAWNASDAGQVELAQSSADESEQILRKLYQQNSQAYSDSFAQSLIVQGVVLSGKHDCDGVARKITEATQVSASPNIAQVAGILQKNCQSSH